MGENKIKATPVIPLFVYDELIGRMVPNRPAPKEMFMLYSKSGAHKITAQRGQAIGWLTEAISKTDDPSNFWIEVI